ncbi:MAG: hydroxymethylglutaryl-CoA lyase [Solirubrobacteraceae bacterium]
MTDVTICDVGPRDGLQNLSQVLDCTVRAELVDRLAAAGVPMIEAVSFVHPERVPTMANAEVVLSAVSLPPETRCTALVLNRRGFERLAVTGLREVRFSFAVSDTFNRHNSNASFTTGLTTAREVIEAARALGIRVAIVLATAFGCPFEGEIDPGFVIEIAADLAHAGADELIFADTIGVAVPRQVRALVTPALALGPTVGVHMHNTRNTGYVTTFAAIEAGVAIADAAVGGLGGCPFAPNATGNIATEDLVYALEREGVDTGIDLEALIHVASWLEECLAEPLDGQVHRAGGFPLAPTALGC